MQVTRQNYLSVAEANIKEGFDFLLHTKHAVKPQSTKQSRRTRRDTQKDEMGGSDLVFQGLYPCLELPKRRTAG